MCTRRKSKKKLTVNEITYFFPLEITYFLSSRYITFVSLSLADKIMCAIFQPEVTNRECLMMWVSIS